MPLAAGTRLGPYEIVAPLGAGGMGEVFRARDTRLGREVAVKVLAEGLTRDAEVRARFEREARTVSSLNHPHICTLHDVGKDGDTDFLVMELVEGETLADRITRGALPSPEVLRIGGQIADALDRAHRARVIHRDLKPGNVMLTRSGAKLMDFGLARATSLAGPAGKGGSLGAAFTQSPTVAQPLTAEGMIVGTFQYMSPEQLEGREADARSDIWALGCVLYEMATGKRAFEGKSQASLISAIMSGEPAPMAQLAPMTPPTLDRLVRQCLAKDPDERIQSAHDLKLQLAGLNEAGSAWSAAMPAATVAAARSRARNAALLPWAVAALAVIAALALLVTRRDGGTRAPTRTVIAAPFGTRMHLSGDDAGPPALSPDGRQLVFNAIGQGGGSRLWLRRMDELTARPLPGTEGGTFPFWSPDGRSIAFFTTTHLKRLDLDGGAVLTLAPAPGSRGGSWSKSGVILYTPGYVDGLMRIPASGGTPAVVTKLDAAHETTHRWPQMLPDGKHFIYLAANHSDPAGTSAIWYGSLAGGTPRKLFDSPSSALFASGWLLFVRDSTLLAQRFDAGSGRLSGEPVSTAEVVQLDPTTWRTVLTASDNGLLVYGLGGRTTPFRITWFDRSGQVLRHVGDPANHIEVALAPDGRRMVIETQYTPNADLWLHNLENGTSRRITSAPVDESYPVWSPDGGRIAFSSQQRQVGSGTETFYRAQIMRGDGAGEPVVLLADSAQDVMALSWSPDGGAILVGRGSYRNSGIAELWQVTLATGKAEIVLPASHLVSTAAYSPDGRWIAFTSLSTGRPELVIVAAPRRGETPDPNARLWQITSAGGDKPVWRADGRELYYQRPDGTLIALAVAGTGSEFRVASETPLFQAFQRAFVHSYDVTPDGQRFVVIVSGGDNVAPLAVVSDWTRTLRRR
jgi:Tol biopolymer transport system component